MTDDELISKIRHIVQNGGYLPTVFCNGHVTTVAAYCMGSATSDAYANFYEGYTPWTPQFQAARVMDLFDSTPAAINIALVLYTASRGNFAPVQYDNFIQGAKALMSDYAGRKLSQIINKEPCVINRTYDTVLQIVQLAKLLNVLESSNQSMPMDQVEHQLKSAKLALMPFCNKDVDAHPLAKTALATLIELCEAKL